MRIKRYTMAALAFAAAVLSFSSCEKEWFFKDRGRNGEGVDIRLKSPSAGLLRETKAGQSTVLNNVFGSEDGELVIGEYVSDIDDFITPETKGTEIKQTTSGGNFNETNRQFQVMAFIDTVKTVSGVDETCHINEFSLPVKYNGSQWNWVLGTGEKEPCWRTSTKYSIWSYWPMDGDLTSGSRSAVSEPDGGNWATSGKYNTVSFTHTVPKALEAQQDLLFAYNEETRDFAHVGGDEKNKYVYEDKEQTWIDTEINDSQIFDGTNSNPKSRNIDIHFYHALAAVKFELNSSTTGADVHSITLCSTDNTTSHNIITDDGIATSGSCTATGNPASTGDKVTFAWTNLGAKKPLHYEFDSSHSVAGGYTTTGNGVLFMIPQSLSGLKVIVEFSKNGSTQYYTKVVNLPAVTWAAGKYYKYKLSIGEFHVPGEKMPQLTNVAIPGLKPKTGNYSFKRPCDEDGNATPIPIKGVTKMGLSLNGYGLGAKPQDNQTVYMYCNKYGSDNSLSAPGDGFQFNFTPVTAVTGNSDLFTFGTDNTSETYYNCYSFTPTEAQTKYPESEGVPKYYVFDTAGETEFLLYFKPSAGDNSGGFMADLQGLIVLEVEKDTNLPGNFPLTTWP